MNGMKEGGGVPSKEKTETKIEKIPVTSYDAASKKITLRGASQFPLEILDLADSVEILDASNCAMSALPENFGRLEKLKVAFFSNNEFEEVPEVLSQCPDLFMVAFKSCKISRLPENALPTSVRWLMLTD